MTEITVARLTTLADEIRTEVASAEADFQSAVKHAITAGEKLIEAKTLVRHGEWLPWLEANFPGGTTTAQNYMRLSTNAQRVAHFPTVREAVALLTSRKRETACVDPPAATSPAAPSDFEALSNEAAAAARAIEVAQAAVPEILESDRKELQALLDAWRNWTRAISRLALAVIIHENLSGEQAARMARMGVAGLAYADHYDPWDERNDECEQEYRAAALALYEARPRVAVGSDTEEDDR